MYHSFFILSYADGHLGCFHVLAIVSSAAVNIGVHVSFQIMVFFSSMPRNRIAGSYGSSVFNFFIPKKAPFFFFLKNYRDKVLLSLKNI